MAAGWTTLTIKDGGGNSKTMRVWAEDTTSGPYSFGQVLADGSGTAALAKKEDDPAVSGDFGLLLLGVRRDTAASSAGTDGDYATVNLDASGRVHVNGSGVTQPVSHSALTNFGAGEYETVAASAGPQALGATGASGDYISGILVVPASTSPGNILLRDGSAGSDITLFAGGAASVSNLVPFFIPLGMVSTASGGWRVTTGANVSCIGIGNFT